ncbi:MAG: hypothetical protein QOG83_2650 [Alphaproteobacteria bacterium]|nr:hypothetical protein [Alphaproteobacteria bacterium]
MLSPEGFHQEFGYFCPTPRFRRSFRVAFIAALFGATAGAIGVLALLARPDTDGAGFGSAMAAGVAEPLVAEPSKAAPPTVPAPVAAEKPPEQPAATVKKRQKSVQQRTRQRTRERQDFDARNAYASPYEGSQQRRDWGGWSR